MVSGFENRSEDDTSILAMAAVTYLTKASGLRLVGRVELAERVEAGLDVLPGAVVVGVGVVVLVRHLL